MRITAVILLILIVPGSLAAQDATEHQGSIGVKIPAGKSSPSVTDSLKISLNKVDDSLGYVVDKASAPMKDIQAGNVRLTGLFDSLKRSAVSKTDTRLVIPDSVAGKSVSPDRLKSMDVLSKEKEKLSEMESSAQEKVNMPADKVNEKLSLITSEMEGEGNLPSQVNAPDINTHDLAVPDTGIDAPSLSGMDNTLQEKMPEIGSGFNPESLTDKNHDLSEINPIDRISEIKSSGELKQLRDASTEISEVTDDAEGHAGDLKEIKTGDVDKAKYVEDKIVSEAPIPEDLAGEVDKAKRLEDEMISQTAMPEDVAAGQEQLTEQAKDMRASVNMEEYRRQTLARSKEIRVKQFAAFESKVQESIAKVSQYQQRGDGIFTKVKGIPKPKRKENDTPFIERFVPGLTLQVLNSDVWFIDVNPSIRFHVSKILSIGSGWNDRICVSSLKKMDPHDRVYGVRNFAELIVRKGFSARLDVESMRTYVPVSLHQYDEGEFKVVWSFMAGMKKEFSFVEGVRGNAQFMYNLYDPKKQSAYASRFNVRLGFEFPIKSRTGEDPKNEE